MWALALRTDAFTFRDWLDTRSIAFLGATDRTSDTVAHFERADQHGVPWVLAVEFQSQPMARPKKRSTAAG